MIFKVKKISEGCPDLIPSPSMKIAKCHKTVAQCLASYLGNLGKFSMHFSVDFQASTGKKFWGKTMKNSWDREI